MTSQAKKRKLQQIENETRAAAAQTEAALRLAQKLDVEQEERLEMHRKITAKIVPFGETITVSVGEGTRKQDFVLPKNLLTLHSGYFADYYANAGEDKKAPAFPNLEPINFFYFASWLFTGKRLNLLRGLAAGCINTWDVGLYLRAPAFQNLNLDLLRTFYKGDEIAKIDIDDVEYVYETFGEDTKIRQLLSHAAARLGPLQRYKEGSKEHTGWKALLRRQPDLAFDIAAMAGKDWHGTSPGDDEYRSLYLEEEIPLEDLWEQRILAFRSINVIKARAKDGTSSR